MEDPEAYLLTLTVPLASARQGSPFPVVRFSLEAVANAFVMLGLLPEARAEEILAAQRPVLEVAGFRVGLEIGELSLRHGARGFQQARAAGADSLRRIPLAVAAGPVHCRLRGHDVTITSVTPESGPPLPTRCSPSARCRPAARCSPTVRNPNRATGRHP